MLVELILLPVSMLFKDNMLFIRSLVRPKYTAVLCQASYFKKYTGGTYLKLVDVLTLILFLSI